MAQEEIVKILKVETGDSQQTVKGLREEIKELRDAVLNLEEGTDDYDKAVAKLQKDQKELDKVMSLTKKGTTAVKGSYDALTQQMSLLKKEWKATNDEAKRDELGKKIREINDQLKSMDESTGNFSRNVGNYTESIVDAFEELNHQVDEFKNKAADAWEKGDIEAYTQAIEDAGKAQARVEKIEQDLEASTPTLEKGFQGLTDTAAGLAGGFEAIQAIMVLTGKETGNFEQIMQKFQLTMALVQGMQALGGLPKALKATGTAIKAVSATIKGVMASNPIGWIMLAVGAIASLTTALIANSKASKDNRSRIKELTAEQELLAERVKATADAYGQLEDSYKAVGQNPIEAKENTQKEVERDIAITEEKLKSLDEKFQKMLSENPDAEKFLEKKLKKFEDEYKYVTEAYAKILTPEVQAKFEDKLIVNKSIVDRLEEFRGAFADLEGMRQRLETLPDEIAALKLKTAQDLMGIDDEYLESQKSTLQQMLDRHEKEKKLYEDAGQDTTVLLQRQKQEIADYYKALADERDALLNDVLEEIENMEIPEVPIDIEFKPIVEEPQLNYQAGLSKKNENIDLEQSKKLEEKKKEILQKGYENQKEYQALEEELRDAEYEITLETEEKKLAALREYWEMAPGLEKLDFYQQICDKEVEIEQIKNERLSEEQADYLAKKEERQQAYLETFSASSEAIATVLKGVADAYQADLDAQLAAGTISQKEYEKKFEKIKGLQIAEATVNTISGAIAAYMSAQTLPPPFNFIVGGINAATVTAAGIAQIAQIKKTTAGSSNIERGMVQPPANIFSNAEPTPTHNITGLKETEELNKDTKVYILESDLQESGKRVKVREDESSF